MLFRRFLVLVLVMIAALGVVGSAAAHEGDADAHKAIIDKLMTEVLSGGNLDLVNEIYAPDFVDVSPFGETKGADGMMAYIGNLRTAFPDMNVKTELLLADGDWVAGRFIVTGTFTGELVTPSGAVPGNNAKLYLPVHHIWEVNEDGLLQSSWTEFDNLSLLTQIGVLPAPDQPAAMMDDRAIDFTINAMSEDQIQSNKDGVQAITDEVFNGGNYDFIDKALAANFVDYPDAPNRAVFKNTVMGIRAAIPDLKATTQPIIGEGDWVAFHFEMAGTFTNPLGEGDSAVPPTGKPFSSTNILIGHFNEKGEMDMIFEMYDNIAFLTALGVIPPMGG